MKNSSYKRKRVNASRTTRQAGQHNSLISYCAPLGKRISNRGYERNSMCQNLKKLAAELGKKVENIAARSDADLLIGYEIRQLLRATKLVRQQCIALIEQEAVSRGESNASANIAAKKQPRKPKLLTRDPLERARAIFNPKDNPWKKSNKRFQRVPEHLQ